MVIKRSDRQICKQRQDGTRQGLPYLLAGSLNVTGAQSHRDVRVSHLLRLGSAEQGITKLEAGKNRGDKRGGLCDCLGVGLCTFYCLTDYFSNFNTLAYVPNSTI